MGRDVACSSPEFDNLEIPILIRWTFAFSSLGPEDNADVETCPRLTTRPKARPRTDTVLGCQSYAPGLKR
ncbi:protein of unknown function [Candidatus Methylocalor cossyra]|uniref:Uncharacterized protein n=1 Tax=Candidatus Methylocalor cossyra TaxID=3108543 RepID=A0ABP1C6M3_9GAMM